jgi:hypothetical protein
MAHISATPAPVVGSGGRQGCRSFQQQNGPASTTTAYHDARPSPATQALRAIIIGSNQAEANGVTARGHAPVLALCRALIEAGHDPNTSIAAYRGATLCLKVRSIGEGTRLTVKETTRDGKPRFVTYRPGPDGAGSVRDQPYVAQTAGDVRRPLTTIARPCSEARHDDRIA